MNPVSLLSLGPGGRDNVTLGVVDQLRRADIVYCFGTKGESCAARIIESLELDNTLRLETIDLPMNDDGSEAQAIYQHVAEQICADVKNGRKAAVATIGDASIYATIQTVKNNLEAMGIPCEQTAGVPSFIAATSVAGLELVRGKQRLVVIPGRTTAEEVLALTAEGHVVVVMKLSRAAEAVNTLITTHPELQFHYFESIGTPNQIYKQIKPQNPQTSNHKPQITNQTTPTFPYLSLMIIKQ